MNIIAVTGAANDLIPLPENLPLSSINSAFAFVVAAFAVEEEVVGLKETEESNDCIQMALNWVWLAGVSWWHIKLYTKSPLFDAFLTVLFIAEPSRR